jgi:hypothetical protein
MHRKIQKFKITNTDQAEVVYEEIFEGEDAGKDKVTKECSNRVHPDLIAAFKELDIHLATLTEQGEFTEFEDAPEKLEIFRTTQLSIGGEGEHEGVTLTGQRTLKENGVLNLNARFTKFNQEHCHHYSYAETLNMSVQNALRECDEYLNGKSAPSPQLSLFDGQDQESEPDAVEKVKKPRKTRKLDKAVADALGDEGDNIEVAVEN